MRLLKKINTLMCESKRIDDGENPSDRIYTILEGFVSQKISKTTH